MAIAARLFGKREEESDSDSRLIEDIRELHRRIDAAYTVFEMQKDSNLVEASIYEIESLKARSRYLHSLAREKNLISSPEGSLLKWE